MHHSFLQQRSRFESKVFQQNEKNVFWYIYAMIEYIPIKVKKKWLKHGIPQMFLKNIDLIKILHVQKWTTL